MKIETKQQLKEILQLCRKQGVQSIRLPDGTEFHLGDLPVVQKKAKKYTPSIDSAVKTKYPLPNEITEVSKIVNEINAIDSDTLSEEDLLYYSARSEDPSLQENQ